MSKNEVKPEAGELDQNDQVAAEFYSEKTSLSGPRPYFGTGPAPCNLLLSREVLQASGLWANFEVELVARPGEILVKLIAPPKPHPWETPRPDRGGIISDLMAITEERLARQRFAREGGYLSCDDEEGEDPLSEGQLDQEAL